MKKITWLGHAAFKIELQDLTILMDPWIRGNPVSPLKNYKTIPKADLVFVTHDHGDHGFKDAIRILPICSTYMMGIREAVWAVGKVRPKTVIPMHYNTFPELNTDAEGFKKKIGSLAKVEILKIGESLSI